MVIRKNLNKKFALLSVYDKNNLRYLCSNLLKNNYGLISTGSTGDKIRSMGFKCIDLSKITKLKEMFDGRIKTLHHLVYASLLYVKDNQKHRREFLSLGIPNISIVIVNLYPFEKFSKNNEIDKTLEMIDIGGPSLLRAASKNFKYITAIMNIKDYPKLINNLKKNDGETDINFRKIMACNIFKQVSNYDKLIAKWLNEIKK